MKDVFEQSLKDIGAELVHYSDNLTTEYDYERAMPCMSFRLTVRGGKKKQIAEIIWKYKPMGIFSHGSTKVKIKDCCGYKHNIYFERIK